MNTRKAKNTSADNWSYEQAVQEIETIVRQLEMGDLPLSQVFSQFETAVQSLQQCEAFLKEKREQVDLLIETLEE